MQRISAFAIARQLSQRLHPPARMMSADPRRVGPKMSPRFSDAKFSARFFTDGLQGKPESFRDRLGVLKTRNGHERLDRGVVPSAVKTRLSGVVENLRENEAMLEIAVHRRRCLSIAGLCAHPFASVCTELGTVTRAAAIAAN